MSLKQKAWKRHDSQGCANVDSGKHTVSEEAHYGDGWDARQKQVDAAVKELKQKVRDSKYRDLMSYSKKGLATHWEINYFLGKIIDEVFGTK